MSEVRLVRTAFKTSRLLDFVGERELTAQIGHETADWARVIGKELADNGIDAAEEHGIAPSVEISVSIERNEIVVADNGPGIPVKTIRGVLDFNSRVSSREAYVSPSRGMQGNALKVLVAMPFALDGKRGETLIEAHGVAHRIAFAVDPVRQEPRISHETERSVVKKGTRVTLRWPPTACSLLEEAQGRFLQMALAFGLFNPHLALSLTWNGALLVTISPSNPGWQKWRGSDPTSAHWYDRERLERLMSAYVADDLDHKRERTAREFVEEFRGLRGSTKPPAVLDAAGLGRPSLASFFEGSEVNHNAVARLLAAMKANSKPVNPEGLGVIGRDHFAAHLVRDGADPANFRYKRVGGERDGIPYLVEAAFVSYPDDRQPKIITGVNWSSSINQPFRFHWRQFGQFLSERSIYRSSPVCLAVHFACPRPAFTDRGKSTLAIPLSTEVSFGEAIEYVTANWAKSEKAQEREEERDRRASERRQKAAAAPPKRAKNIVVGTGVLHQEIEAAAAGSPWSINDLTVLSRGRDPYRFDDTTGHEVGQWFKDQIERLVSLGRRVHLRGLFYRIVATGDVRKPDGKAFTNTYDNWVWLVDRAAKAARWLGYVPFNRISDERNAAPRVFFSSALTLGGTGSFTPGGAIEIPELGRLLPGLGVIDPSRAQLYRIIFLGEKSSLGDVLEPIVEQVHGELLLPTGETTDTMIAEAVERAAADGRPAVVLYFSDFDPAGWQMTVSVSRKLQAMRTMLYPGLQIELHRVALTLDQVRHYNLPSTPLKDTEKRKSRWRQVMQHEQTEIDALATLRPDDLREIALAAVAPFFDFTLATRCRTAAEAWLKEARAKIADDPALAAMKDKIAEAHSTVTTAIDALHQIQAAGFDELKDQLGIENALIPAPEVQIEATAPAPMFTTADDFAMASRKLIAQKKYEDDDEETGDDDA